MKHSKSTQGGTHDRQAAPGRARQAARLLSALITHPLQRTGTGTRPEARLNKKRMAATLAAVVALSGGAALATSVTLGFFSAATATQTNQFSAGTVTLTSNVSGACQVSGLLPGSSGSPCTLQVAYSGSVPAYLGLDVLVATSTGGTGTLPLYNPSDPTNDLQVSVFDNQTAPVAFVQPAPSATNFGPPLVNCPSPYGSGYTCYQLTDLLVSISPFTNGQGDTFTTSVSVPTTSATGYQGGTASIVLLAHAVQAGNQSLGSCAAGSPCTTVSWS